MADMREIYVLNKKVRLLQPAEGFRTSMDSVMLAAACPIKEGETFLDMGCGVGGAGFCVLWRVAGTQLTGVELQDSHVALAEENIGLNKMEGRAEFVCDDIRRYQSAAPFNHVICNPPYLEAGHHSPSPRPEKAVAMGHEEEALSVSDWIDAGFRNLKSKGSLTMIHRADAADRMIRAMGKRFGDIEIIPLWPKAGAPAKRMIIRARKDRKGGAILHPGVILHEKNGKDTKEADLVLREGRAL
ncbi:MAG: methyltransferase [Rhodospirillales bacterium]|nr:methyltransferase [Alphaproteobacteria bacterium]USO03612.1 MAG: methyltransferase [Rhodospirillales bacterium]